MEMIKTVDTPAKFDEVDALIDELETQFGEERMMPQSSYPPPTNSCTVVESCAC